MFLHLFAPPPDAITHPILGLPLLVVTDDHPRIPNSIQGEGLRPAGVIHLDFGLKRNQEKKSQDASLAIKHVVHTFLIITNLYTCNYHLYIMYILVHK